MEQNQKPQDGTDKIQGVAEVTKEMEDTIYSYKSLKENMFKRLAESTRLMASAKQIAKAELCLGNCLETFLREHGKVTFFFGERAS